MPAPAAFTWNGKQPAEFFPVASCSLTNWSNLSLAMSEWALLTNHANVLLCVTEEPDIRLRDLAVKIDISERAVKRIVADLEQAGYISRERQGRRNHYLVHGEAALSGPVTHGMHLGALISALLPVVSQL